MSVTVSTHPPWSFFSQDSATAEIYTLSLHDALPISAAHPGNTMNLFLVQSIRSTVSGNREVVGIDGDRKSTRLNSSHMSISYAVFCLKKKKKHGVRQPVPQDSAVHPRLKLHTYS